MTNKAQINGVGAMHRLHLFGLYFLTRAMAMLEIENQKDE
jgi:hypothetical protein